VAACSDGRLGRGTVLVDRWDGDNVPLDVHDGLLRHLLGSVALACRICDPQGTRPFKKPGALEVHLSREHGAQVCGVCLREGHAFPLELELFSGRGGLARHIKETHPECKFCRGRPYYSADALWQHMHQVRLLHGVKGSYVVSCLL
jgi:hypothetical protein